MGAGSQNSAAMQGLGSHQPSYSASRPQPSFIGEDGEQFLSHYNWLVNASSRGNAFAQSLLSQLRRGWMLTAKQMAAIERSAGTSNGQVFVKCFH